MRTSFVALLLLVAGGSFAADPPKADPASDLKVMQGKWKADHTKSFWPKSTVDRLDLNKLVPDAHKQFASLHVEKNRLYFGSSKEPCTFANDLGLEKEIAVKKGYTLFRLTTSDGSTMLGSYIVDGDEVEMRFPHTCTCTRTGATIRFVRPAKE